MEYSGVFVVATPIGNLGDISPRAVDVLANVDFIAAEDTRNTVKLLNHLGIKKELVAYHAHNIAAKSEYLINRVKNGESFALVSDAGTPAISDPGEELIKKCHEEGIKVSPIPGPSAVITALSASGMRTNRFTFEGFLSTCLNSRKEHLESLVNEKRTMVFYEAPHKLVKTLEDLYKYFGNRKLTLARELTKFYEEIDVTDLEGAINKYTEKAPLGEFVLILEGKPDEEILPDYDEAERIFNELVSSGMSKTEAVKETSKKTGLRKNDLYQRFAK